MRQHLWGLAGAVMVLLSTDIGAAQQTAVKMTSVKNETSIVKNMALLKQADSRTVANGKNSLLDQLIRENEQQKTATASTEEKQAVASIRTQAQYLLTSNQPVSRFLHSLFGG